MNIPKNIVLLVVDSLRADHLSCYGYSTSTPNIDILANTGIQHMNAKSAGTNTRHSVPHILSEYLYLGLRKRGYFPYVIHTNPHVGAYLNKYNYEHLDLNLKAHTTNKVLSRLNNLWGLISTGIYKGEAIAEELNDYALKTLNILKKPFFLCLWYMDVHVPYFPPNKTKLTDLWLNRKYINAIKSRRYTNISNGDINRLKENYDAEITYFDKSLGKLLEQINNDTTIVVFTSDHGEEFMENGDLGHRLKDTPTLHNVPLIIKHPKKTHKKIYETFSFTGFDKYILSILDEKYVRE